MRPAALARRRKRSAHDPIEGAAMRYRHWALAACVSTLTLVSASAQRGEPPPLPAPIRQDRPGTPAAGYEVQTRGPVHEAFLEPTDTLPQPRVVRQPPPGEILE